MNSLNSLNSHINNHISRLSSLGHSYNHAQNKFGIFSTLLLLNYITLIYIQTLSFQLLSRDLHSLNAKVAII